MACLLSPRQCELVRLLRRGETVKTAAVLMGCSYNTAKAHRDKILERFSARTIAEAADACRANNQADCP